ncbi:MAG: hypothetical protein RL344_675 [Pseudomonadota bacterium]|jgi:outer membrane protein assembly factor BamE
MKKMTVPLLRKYTHFMKFNYQIMGEYLEKYRLLTVCVVFSLIFSGCTVYKKDIAQGNKLEIEQVNSLKVGMTRQKVQQILGTPLLQDIFNQQRSDYVHRHVSKTGEIEQEVLTVFYNASNQLLSWSGVGLPSSTDAVTVPNQKQDLFSEVSAANKPLQVMPVISIPTPVAVVANKIKTVEQQSQPSPVEPLIKNKIEAWQRAWQAKLLPQYASLYADGYVATAGSHELWLKQRQNMFDISGDILVLNITDMKIIQTNDDEVRATFTQQYQSNILKETGTKQLYFQRFGDEWKIVAERFFKAK